jgi:hypothetical protein
MTGIRSKIVIVGIAALALAACSSGPTPMQKWTPGAGGACLAKVERGLTSTTSNPSGTIAGAQDAAGALFVEAGRCSGHAPPVGGSQFTSAMADIASAMLFFESGTNAGGNATDATISESDAAFTAPSPTPERSCAARPQARPGRLG